MKNAQHAKPVTKTFSVSKFILCVVAAFLADSLLAIAIPFFMFAVGGFNIHASSSPNGLPAYILINSFILAYTASKGRDAVCGFFVGALLSTLLVWEFIN
jgi:hypothetical protein